MKFIKKHFFIYLIMVFIACGTVAVDYSADFQGPDDVTVTVGFLLTGELATMAKNSSNVDDGPTPDSMEASGWSVEVIEDAPESLGYRGTKRFQGEDALRLLSGDDLDTDNQVVELRMSETDRGDFIEYRIEIPVESLKDTTSDAQSEDSSANNSNDEFGKGMEDLMLESLKDMFNLDISFSVFGEIVETNADQQLDNLVSWEYNLKTSQEATEGPYVVTRVSKNTGLFGSCSGASASSSSSSAPVAKPNATEATVVKEKPTEVPTLTPTVTAKPIVFQPLPYIPAIPTPPQLTNTPVQLAFTSPTATSTVVAIVTPTHVPTPAPTLVPTATPTFTPTPTLVLPGKSKQKPITLGETLPTDYGVNLKVLSLNYDAWEDIAFINQFNSPPKDGMKYVLVDMQVEVVEGYINDYFDINFDDFGAVGSGVAYEGYCLNAMAMELLGLQLYNQGKSSGILCFEVPVEEKDLTVFYDFRDADFNSTRYWLQAGYNEAFPALSMAPTTTNTPTMSPTPTITSTPLPTATPTPTLIDGKLLLFNGYRLEDELTTTSTRKEYYIDAVKGKHLSIMVSSTEIEPRAKLTDFVNNPVSEADATRVSEGDLLYVILTGANRYNTETGLSDSSFTSDGRHRLIIEHKSPGSFSAKPGKFVIEVFIGDLSDIPPTPTPTMTATPKPYSVDISGVGNTYSEPFILEAGLHSVEFANEGSSNFSVSLLDERKLPVQTVATGILGPTTGSEIVNVEEAKTYIIYVVSNGAWLVKIR